MANIYELFHSVSMADVGVKEAPGAANNPVVVEYYAQAGFPEIKQDSVPWCAAWLGAKLAEIGVLPSGSLLARSYTHWGEEVQWSQARRGDIVVLERGEPWQGHVGVWDSATTDHVTLISGNQADAVTVKAYPRSRVITIRRIIEQRESRVDSKQFRVSSYQITAGATTLLSGFFALEGQERLMAMGAGVVIVLFGLWFFKERLSKWRKGVR